MTNNITHQGVDYAMDVEFKNQFCNCAPSEIKGYGRHARTKGSCENFQNIPRLPDELFDVIWGPTKQTATRTPRITPTTATTPSDTPTASKTQMADFRAQLDNRATRIMLGRILWQHGALWTMWDGLSKRSKKYKPGECKQTWGTLRSDWFAVGRLFDLTREGSPERLEQTSPNLNMNKQVFFDDVEYPAIEIDTPFQTPNRRTHRRPQTRRPSKD